MSKYQVDFTVNGIRTNTIVTAISSGEAEKLVKAQYANAKSFRIVFTKKVD